LSCASFDYFTNYIYVLICECISLKKHHAATSPMHQGTVVPLENVPSDTQYPGDDVDKVDSSAPEPSKIDQPPPDATDGEKKEKVRCPCPALRQQRLKACECNPISHTLHCLFGISAIFFLTGILLLLHSQSAMQLEIQYDGKRLGPDTNSFVYSPCKVPGPTDRKEWEWKGDSGLRPRAFEM